MNRIRDYTNFAAWFIGLGYIALWPVMVPASGGEPFAAAVFCRGDEISLPDLLCNSSRLLHLPVGLHALGFLSAIFVAGRLIMHAIRRSRRAPVSSATGDLTLPVSVPPPRRNPAPLGPNVKPRSQFGLRGLPQ